MPIVLDCSVAAAWALADERTAWTLTALQSTIADGAMVPSLFWYEIRNILVLNERRGRIVKSQTEQFLRDIEPLTEVDLQPSDAELLALARGYKLTVYDAAYLELANRLRLALCTLDRQLLEAAPRAGVALWHP
jgi:predicted nucleic acid-binding protein